MKRKLGASTLCVTAALACSPEAEGVQLISNGGFETGFAGWTRADQAGSVGGFLLQTGTTSPVNGFAVPIPPQGTRSAMTDAGAGGSHVLYQDFTVPLNILDGTISFSLFINSGDAFRNPTTLDWAATNQNGTLNLNQQARVDILRPSANPFSVSAGDVLRNLYQTLPTDPLVAGYNNFSADISSLLLANQGQTLRLRFAEVDNVSFLNFGVDQVGLVSAVPEPAPWTLILAIGGLLSLTAGRDGRHRRPFKTNAPARM